MLTIFGKKKKDGTGDSPKEGQAPSTPSPIPAPISQAPVSISASGQGPSAKPTSPPSKPVQNPPQPQPTARPATPQPIFRPPPYAPLPSEETSLTKLLQSLLQDIPLPPDVASTFGGVTESTPDYVPPRPTPPSRPMVISPGRGSGEWEEQEEEPAKPTAAPTVKPKPPDIQPQVKVSPPPPPVGTKRDQPAEKAPEKAPEKPSKVEKQLEKPEKPSKEAPKETRTPQSFDHIFELTKGNLENPGFVIINGVEGSGRTTLCSGLTGNYMKNENPCIYLTYDQSPEELRGQIKKLGTDPAKYESQFRFILIDGYSSQSEAFSMEPYYVEQPFSFESVREAVERNSEFFIGEKTKIIFDSLDRLVAKSTMKDLAKNLGDLVQKMKDAGATFIVTIDMSEVPKDMAGSLNDMADCIIELSKDDSGPEGRQLKVQRLNHSSAKVDPEKFEIDDNKGLVFV